MLCPLHSFLVIQEYTHNDKCPTLPALLLKHFKTKLTLKRNHTRLRHTISSSIIVFLHYNQHHLDTSDLKKKKKKFFFFL